MTDNGYVQEPDVVLIGAGVMSANLSVLLKRMDPSLKIQVFEVASEIAQEASNGWNNAGTGHAGICELSYTPHQSEDGSVDVSKAISMFEDFEHSKQLWASAVRDGMIENPGEFIKPLPHISFVHGEKQVGFLTARFDALKRHHFFSDMEFSTDPDTICQWAPLLIEGRDDMPVAATKMDGGTDVNFGAVSQKLLHWFSQQPDCSVATSHRVTDLKRSERGWKLTIKDLKSGKAMESDAKFVFIGAGGGSLTLLQKSGIPEIRGYGGFPVGGQWMVCEKPETVALHNAKVYGQAQDEAPTMAVPHLDTRVIDGQRYLLFGPFAAWTTKFLHEGGRWTDLPSSVKLSNLGTLLKVGISNLELVRYLVKEGTQSMNARMKLLRTFYPDAKDDEWELKDAGIRVQAIKKEDGEAGIVHFGTEVLASADKSICALLGASPGASVCVQIMIEVIETCMPELISDPTARANLEQIVPTYGKDFIADDAADEFKRLSDEANNMLELTPVHSA